MKIGDVVEFKHGLFADEIGARYKILELNGDRAVLQFMCDLPLPPQSVARVDALRVINYPPHDTQPWGPAIART